MNEGPIDPADQDVVELPLEDSIDLHAFQPRDVKDVVEAYIEEASAAGMREVRIIHGRGIGAQRKMVQKLLERDPRVESYGDAPSERGGWGATIARLSQRPPIDV